MIVPALITGGILGGIALFAPRVDVAAPARPALPAVTQQIDVMVNPAQYQASPQRGGNPARDSYLALLDMGFTNVIFAGTSDPDLSRFAQGTTVTFAYTVTGTPRHVQLPPWMSILFTGRSEVLPPQTTPAPATPGPQPGTPATPPGSLPTMPMTRAQVLLSRAEAALAQGAAAEPVILESIAGDIAAIDPNYPYVQQLLQLAQANRIRRAQEVP